MKLRKPSFLILGAGLIALVLAFVVVHTVAPNVFSGHSATSVQPTNSKATPVPTINPIYANRPSKIPAEIKLLPPPPHPTGPVYAPPSPPVVAPNQTSAPNQLAAPQLPLSKWGEVSPTP